MKKNKSRRNFIKKSALIGSGLFIIPRNVLGGKGYTAPSDQLAVAAVGSGGKGTSDINNAYNKGKNRVVALCDVHPEYAKKSMDRFPDAKIYKDYRVMLEKQKDIEVLAKINKSSEVRAAPEAELEIPEIFGGDSKS